MHIILHGVDEDGVAGRISRRHHSPIIRSVGAIRFAIAPYVLRAIPPAFESSTRSLRHRSPFMSFLGPVSCFVEDTHPPIANLVMAITAGRPPGR